MPTKPKKTKKSIQSIVETTESTEPTEDQLKLLSYFGLSDSDDIGVYFGDQGDYVIEMTTLMGEPLGIVQIPLGEAAHELRPLFDYAGSMGEVFCSYPSMFSDSKRYRGVEERNLKAVLRDLAAHFKAIEDAKLLALRAAEEAAERDALRRRLEYGELYIEDREG